MNDERGARRFTFFWRAGAVLLLVLAYLLLWRPGRAWLTQNVAYPAFSTVLQRPAQVERMEDPLMLAVRSPDGATAHFRAPAGILFLLPALVLIGCFPGRPSYWLFLWLYHLGLGGLTAAALCWGAWGYDAGFIVLSFVRGYIEPATSLAAPIFVFWIRRREPDDRHRKYASRT